MDWLKIYNKFAGVQDGLQQLEELGVPRERAIALVGPDRTEDLEIAAMIEQLRDLEPPAPAAGTDGGEDEGQS